MSRQRDGSKATRCVISDWHVSGSFCNAVFISGNLPFKTEIAPYLIVMRLEEYDYAGAMTMAVVLLVFSFAMLAVINIIEQWANKFAK